MQHGVSLQHFTCSILCKIVPEIILTNTGIEGGA